MKKFYVYYQGKGYGCDYTIGCNLRVEEHEVEDIQEVIDALNQEIEESPSYAEERIESIRVIEVANERKLDIDDIVLNIRKKERAEEEARIEEKEKAELKRLKEKYEKDKK